MQIKCSKCGFENQMGAIFCRQCGEKINMNEISPEALEAGKRKENAGNAASKVVRWTVRILILLVILGVLGAMLAPWGMPVYTAPDENDEFKKKEELALFKLQYCASEKTARILKPVKFSMEELNILFSKRFLSSDENKTAVWTLEHVVLSKEDDRVRMLVFAKLFSVAPVVFQFDGMPSPGGSAETPLAIQVDSASIGHLPLLYCNSFVGTHLGKLLAGNDEIKRAFERAESVALEDDGLLFTFRKPEKPADAASDAAPKAKAASSSDSSRPESNLSKKIKKKIKRKKSSKSLED